MEEIARHFQTGQPVRLAIEGSTIADVAPAAGTGGDEWIAPAFWDIQTNGRWGISFSALTSPLDRRPNKRRKQWLRGRRLRFELRVKLHG